MIKYPKPRDLISQPFVLNPTPMREGFMAIDHYGEVVAFTETVGEALDVLSRVSPGETVVEPNLDGSEGGAVDDELPSHHTLIRNPSSSEDALKATGLPKLDLERDVLSKYDLKKAHAELMEFFSLLPTKAHNTPEGMVERILTENEKTSKQPPAPLEPSWVLGLALLPAAKLRAYDELDDRPSKVKDKIDQLLDRPGKGFARSLPVLREDSPEARRRRWTLCTGSNKACREACLVRVARNADPYNMLIKAVRTMALIERPQAFVRILYEAIKEHGRVSEPCHGYKPFVRLNVLSDIPWEVFVKDLFTSFETPVAHGASPLRFYDYTKVPGRTPPRNYDLTFSFSGTNEGVARAEIIAGRRVAVVFSAMIPKGKKSIRWEPRRYQSTDELEESGKRRKKGPPMPLPKEFWGMGVEDGDLHDVRPYSTEKIIGLRYKTPAGGSEMMSDPSFLKSNFVTRVYHVGGEMFFDQESGEERYRELLIAPVTPDQTGAYPEVAPTPRRR